MPARSGGTPQGAHYVLLSAPDGTAPGSGAQRSEHGVEDSLARTPGWDQFGPDEFSRRRRVMRVAILAVIWLLAAAPLLLRAIRDRARRRREDVSEVLARVVAGAGPSPAGPARRTALPPVWPPFVLSFVAAAGAVTGSTLVAAGTVVALNLLTVAHGRRARSRAVRPALVVAPDRPFLREMTPERGEGSVVNPARAESEPAALSSAG